MPAGTTEPQGWGKLSWNRRCPPSPGQTHPPSHPKPCSPTGSSKPSRDRAFPRAAARRRGTGQGPRRGALTRVPHGGMQQVHGGARQPQPVHAVRGLFKVRHHAKSRAGFFQSPAGKTKTKKKKKEKKNSNVSGGERKKKGNGEAQQKELPKKPQTSGKKIKSQQRVKNGARNRA